MYLPKWEVGFQLLFQVYFQHCSFFLPSKDKNLLSFVIVPQVPEIYPTDFLNLLSIVCSDWVISNILSSSSFLLSSIPSTLLLSPATEVFLFLEGFFRTSYFSVLKVPFGSLYFSISLLRLFSHLFQACF